MPRLANFRDIEQRVCDEFNAAIGVGSAVEIMIGAGSARTTVATRTTAPAYLHKGHTPVVPVECTGDPICLVAVRAVLNE